MRCDQSLHQRLNLRSLLLSGVVLSPNGLMHLVLLLQYLRLLLCFNKLSRGIFRSYVFQHWGLLQFASLILARVP